MSDDLSGRSIAMPAAVQTTWDVLEEFALAGDIHAYALLNTMRVWPGTVPEAEIVRALLVAKIDVERLHRDHMHNCMRPAFFRPDRDRGVDREEP